MKTYLTGKYIGTESELVGETALLREDPHTSGLVLAQFDNLDLVYKGEHLAYNWRVFDRSDFQITEEG